MRLNIAALLAAAAAGQVILPSVPDTSGRSRTPTKTGPGRRPYHRAGRRRRAPIHGEGSLMELDRRVSELLSDPDLPGKKILRQTGPSVRKLAELELELERA